MNPKIKNLIIFSVIFILLVVGYVVFFRGSPQPALTTTTGIPLPSATAPTGDVGQEFLTTLLNLKNIQLNDSVFNNPAFSKLQDYTITLVPEGNEGRVNPFAPIGTDFSGMTTSTATSTTSSISTAPSL